MPVQSALVFVDWDSSRRIVNSGQKKRRDAIIGIEQAIETLQDTVVKIIGDSGNSIRVSWRIYHGWHEGQTPTADRRLFERFIDQYTSRRVGTISFGRSFAFGDNILCASLRSPLRDTVRRRQNETTGKRELYQKMVDTALISDLLHASRTHQHDYIIVVGDDDDLLPGIFTAEKWGANIHFLRLNNVSHLPLLRRREKGFPMSNIERPEAKI
jgi:hypothetical protein